MTAVGEETIYVLDFKSGEVTAHYAAHGKDNGPNARAVKFKGFQRDLDMVPLVRLRPLIPKSWITTRRLWTGTTEAFIQT